MALPRSWYGHSYGTVSRPCHRADRAETSRVRDSNSPPFPEIGIYTSSYRAKNRCSDQCPQVTPKGWRHLAVGESPRNHVVERRRMPRSGDGGSISTTPSPLRGFRRAPALTSVGFRPRLNAFAPSGQLLLSTPRIARDIPLRCVDANAFQGGVGGGSHVTTSDGQRPLLASAHRAQLVLCAAVC